jgi:predicted adenine nucleotide alpha hydrolase (AANH) superfamily ATPase
MNILVHICCAPCAVGVLQNLSGNGSYSVTGYYYNPNIHPIEEFQKRKESVEKLSRDNNVPVIYHDEFMLEYWKNSLSKEKRCDACYQMRIDQIAKTAKQKGLDAFTTTLLISPWQDHEKIRKLAEQAAAKYDIGFLYRDFRLFYRQGKNEAYKRGYYLQKYCGCIYSYDESDHKKKPVYEF